MSRRAFFSLLILAACLLFLLSFWKVEGISGLVLDEYGQPLANATVRIRTTQYSTQTDQSGHFALEGFPTSHKVRLTAWADGYYVSGLNIWPWTREAELVLQPYSLFDHAAYEWILPAIEGRSTWQVFANGLRLAPAAHLASDKLFFQIAEELELGCRDCHGAIIYEQWASGAHALGFSNPIFATLYLGTDVHGEQSPLTEFAYSRDYGILPLKPDPDQPYYGPGFKIDFPHSDGNCATCHLPAAALEAPFETNPSEVEGVNALGSHCDYCHKIADVVLDPATGKPYENRPGVLSMVMARPGPEEQLFLGPYDDVDAGSDAYLPLQRESQYCAACHSASFWGVPIYDSFGEWLASSYSDPQTGQTCQDCHMAPDGLTTNFAPGRGGHERDPQEVFSHDFPGASSVELLQGTAELDVQLEQMGGQLVVRVTVTNTGAGHHIPTDSPLRQILLLVSATDANGDPLPLQDGPSLPSWTGDLAGKPGRYFAKILEQLWTEVSPTAAYWTQTRIIKDTRIAANDSDLSIYTFSLPQGARATVDVQLAFRRAFYELAQQKGWDIPDILMEQKTLSFP